MLELSSQPRYAWLRGASAPPEVPPNAVCEFDVQLDKTQQRSNWGQRPLSEEQIKYARYDTRYLLPLMERQISKLREMDRLMIVETECRRLESLVAPRIQFNPDEWVRIKGSRSLKPDQRPVLRRLFILRDTLASRNNQPPFRVMNNQVMLELSMQQPKRMSDLGAVHGFSPRMVRRFGRETLAAIQEGLGDKPIKNLPVLPKRDGTQPFSDLEGELYDRLRVWRKDAAAAMGIESSYLLNRHVMDTMARSQPQDIDDLRSLQGIADWQVAQFGAQLLSVVEEFLKLVERGGIQKKRPWRR